jgi:hypothetical protein
MPLFKFYTIFWIYGYRLKNEMGYEEMRKKLHICILVNCLEWKLQLLVQLSSRCTQAAEVLLRPVSYLQGNVSCLHHNSVARSPQANCTDWADATFRRNLVPAFADRGVSHGQRGGSPTVVNLDVLDRSSSSFILMSLSGSRSRPTDAQKIW